MNRVLDTNIVLYFLGGTLAAPLPDGAYHVSVVTELELLSYPKLTPEQEAPIKAFLSALKIVGLEPGVKEAAIHLRRQHGLKLPDAIIAATAIELDLTLITANVKHFKQIPELKIEPFIL